MFETFFVTEEELSPLFFSTLYVPDLNSEFVLSALCMPGRSATVVMDVEVGGSA